MIAPDAHIRLSAPQTNGAVRVLRRGYSFTDASTKSGRAAHASR